MCRWIWCCIQHPFWRCELQKSSRPRRRPPRVTEKELTAQEWFERGLNAAAPDEEVRFYSKAIRLRPDYADAFYNRGISRKAKGDLEGALEDYSEAIRLKPDFA